MARNRAKRLVRDAFRRRRRDPGTSCDLVVVARPEIVEASQVDVDRELSRCLERLESRLARRVEPRSPRPDRPD